MTEEIERDKLQFEREKFRAEQATADRDRAYREQIEREKMQFERETFQAEQVTADRDHAQRVSEQAFKEAENLRSRWTNPLVLAVFSAALAAAGNAYVASRNGETQLDIASQNHTRQQSLEEQKAEYALMIDIMKSTDPCKAARNLHIAYEAGLLSASTKREPLKGWLANKAEGQSGCATTPTGTAPPHPASAPPNVAPVIEQYQTGWLGGGNSQPTQCAIGQGAVAAKYPGRTIQLIKSWEESKRDFFGHVEYRYFCTFQVG